MNGSYGYECACERLFDVVCYRTLLSTVMISSFLREQQVLVTHLKRMGRGRMRRLVSVARR